MVGHNGAEARARSLPRASQAGLGAGEFSGYFSNLRAVATTLAPLVYGTRLEH